MLASDGGAAEVVHVVIMEGTVMPHQRDGLIRTMRPGGEAPLKVLSGQHGSDYAAIALRSRAND